MAAAAVTEARTYCRTCQACCGTVATVEAGRLVGVRGDRDDPLSRGYACFKGLRAPDHHNDPGRLLQSLIRKNGTLEPCSSLEALAVAGDRLAAIVERHGGSAVGLYMGTQSLFNTPVQPVMRALAAALDSPRLFATMTIDQSAKWIAEDRLGAWHAGPQDFATADVWMLVGANPAVSMVLAGGATHIACPNPIKTLRDARARGMKLIVIDPRRSETAAFADLFLQPRPGTDAFIAASLLQVVLREGWQDRSFCATYAGDLAPLRAALDPLSPERTAAATGLDPHEVRRAAALFASEAQRGMVGTGTGTDMGPHSNLAEHLFQLLNVVCGRFPRAGDRLPNPGVLTPPADRRAEVVRPRREWENGPRTLRHSLGPIRGTMMSTAIADEILSDDPRRMRALICVGGNPAFALPDAARTYAALEALELLIVVDPRLTATARRAHVVLAPTLQYERADHTGVIERLFQAPYAHATPAVVALPEGADLVDDADALLVLARRLRLAPRLGGSTITAASKDDLLHLLAGKGRIPLPLLAERSGGVMADDGAQLVAPAQGSDRFDLLPPDVAEELAALTVVPTAADPAPDQLVLMVRRHREVMNTVGTDLPSTAARMAASTAFVHGAVIARLGLEVGQIVEIRRGNAVITALLARDDAIADACVSLPHCWPSPTSLDEATNQLIDPDLGAQPINRMPQMTGFYVTLMGTKRPFTSFKQRE